eukprot:TRINITY_DN2862_c0_g1_i2.p1 TRINITY_DN2862_c0_g1~~TRINITY_DN2862_c0_g1_i2.p1  ORF type:complete len:514 (+),score=145.32 TRINITY_DN2862_c0_g1_i2:166-1707(+)
MSTTTTTTTNDGNISIDTVVDSQTQQQHHHPYHSASTPNIPVVSDDGVYHHHPNTTTSSVVHSQSQPNLPTTTTTTTRSDDHHKTGPIGRVVNKILHFGHHNHHHHDNKDKAEQEINQNPNEAEAIVQNALAAHPRNHHDNSSPYSSPQSDSSLHTNSHHHRETHKAIVLHPSLATPTHAKAVVVKCILMLYNPQSGAHQGEKIARHSVDLFHESKIEVHTIALERRGHGEELCRTLDLTPFDVVCFIGGDGTFHECVNGLMKRKDKEGSRIPVAMIAGGTGNSFALELVGNTDLRIAVETIKRGVHVPIDLGRVVQLDLNTQGDLQKEEIYSFNSIHWGLASKVNVTAEKLRWMGKAVRYTTAALYELFKGDTTFACIKFEDGFGKLTEYKDSFCCVIANNIVCAAKGMKMAPLAKLNDGLMDLLIIRSQKVMDLMSVFTHVYQGTHTDLSYVEYVQVKWFSIIPYKKDEHSQIALDPDPSAADEVVDIDGELKGATPFRCEMVPHAIKVIV